MGKTDLLMHKFLYCNGSIAEWHHKIGDRR